MDKENQEKTQNTQETEEATKEEAVEQTSEETEKSPENKVEEPKKSPEKDTEAVEEKEPETKPQENSEEVAKVEEDKTEEATVQEENVEDAVDDIPDEFGKDEGEAMEENNKDEFVQEDFDGFSEGDDVEVEVKNPNKKKHIIIAVAVAAVVFGIFCLTTPRTTKTVCSPKEKSALTLTVTMESKEGKVIKLSQEETTKLKDYNMTEKDFKTAAKEIKKGTKTYAGLSYTYEVKDGVGIETLTLDTDKASTDTYTLLGLTTKNGKDGKAVKVSTDKAIQSMENYGLECK